MGFFLKFKMSSIHLFFFNTQVVICASNLKYFISEIDSFLLGNYIEVYIPTRSIGTPWKPILEI